MKKKVTATTIVGFLLLAVGVALFLVSPLITQAANKNFLLYVNGKVWPWDILFPAIRDLFVQGPKGGSLSLLFWIAVSFAGVCVILWIVHLILIIANKRPKGLWVWFFWIISAAATLLVAILALHPEMFQIVKDAGNCPGGLVQAMFGAAKDKNIEWWWFILVIGALALTVIGFIVMLVAEIADMVFVASNPKSPVRDYAKDAVNDDHVVVVRDENDEEVPAATSDEIRAIMHEEINNAQAGAPIAQPAAQPVANGPVCECGRPGAPVMPGSPIGGPFLVQYINTYPAEPRQERNNTVSPEDIRKIIKEEMAEGKKAEEAAKQALSAEDVRRILSEELKALVEPKEDVCVEPLEEAMTEDDIRNIIREELAPKPEKNENVRDIIKEEFAAIRRSQEEDAKAKAQEEAHQRAIEMACHKAAEEARAKALEEIEAKRTNTLTADEIRELIQKEFGVKEEKKAGVSPEDIRDIIREELKGLAPVAPIKVEPAPVVVKEEPAPAVAPAPKVVVEVKPAPTVVATVKPAPRKVGEINPNLPPHDKIIRIPFPTRMLSADKELKANYNELKSDIMAYGVNSRVSNSGDTFRLHRVTFVKLTIAGKGLKLYFALDPKDYKNSTLPIADAGHKGTYAEIPLVFKVKSDLSMRRAKTLIADVMKKNGLEQGPVEAHNWAKDLKDYKPAGGKDED